MKYLFWAVCISLVMTVISVVAEASETKQEAARVAPAAVNRLPASSDPASSVSEDQLAAQELGQELEGASIEVGFTQDNESEPHLLAVAWVDRVQVYQLEAAPERDERVAKIATQPPMSAQPKLMPVKIFSKRIHQAIDEERFFSARQARPKGRCHDRYILRVKYGGRFRERRGCTNQSNDPFAAFAQLFFRDAFVTWSRSQ